MPVGKDGRFTEPVDEYAGMLVFDANLQINDHLKAATAGRGGLGERHRRHRPAPARDLRPLLPPLLALPRAADLQGRLVVVRPGDRRQGPPDRAQRGDPLGPRAHQARPVRQVAGERPRLVDHPQPVLGEPGAGLAQRRPGVPAHRRLRLAGGAGGRLRHVDQGRRPAPTVRRRAHPPEPRRPDRPVDDAAGPRRARRVVRLGLDELRPGALPVRERGLVRAPLPGRLHRRVHRPDPRLVLHDARPGRARSSTGRRSRPA